MKPTIEYRPKGPLTKRQVAQKIAEGSSGAISRGLPSGAKPVGTAKPAETQTFTGYGSQFTTLTPVAKRREYLKLAARERRKREAAAARELGITVAEYRVRKSKGEFK